MAKKIKTIFSKMFDSIIEARMEQAKRHIAVHGFAPFDSKEENHG